MPGIAFGTGMAIEGKLFFVSELRSGNANHLPFYFLISLILNSRKFVEINYSLTSVLLRNIFLTFKGLSGIQPYSVKGMLNFAKSNLLSVCFIKRDSMMDPVGIIRGAAIAITNFLNNRVELSTETRL